MKLEDYKIVFVAVGLVGVLLFASPTLGLVLHLPGGEKFSELWVLGPGHMAEDYPFNVSAGHTYTAFLGVANHMSDAVYYMVYVKLRNESEALPNATLGVASPLPALYTYRVFLTDNGTWEGTLSFSFGAVSVGVKGATIGVVSFNGVVSQVNKMLTWDESRTGCYFQVFAELWMYYRASDSFAYSNRFVGLWMNVTVGF